MMENNEQKSAGSPPKVRLRGQFNRTKIPSQKRTFAGSVVAMYYTFHQVRSKPSKEMKHTQNIGLAKTGVAKRFEAQGWCARAPRS
jgi:hypothetical protein